RDARLRILDADGVELLLGRRKIPVLKRDPGETERYLSDEIVCGQEPLNSVPLSAVRVQDDLGGGPVDVELFYDLWMLAHVHLDRDEVVLDQAPNAFIGVDFGFQPNASASLRR